MNHVKLFMEGIVDDALKVAADVDTEEIKKEWDAIEKSINSVLNGQYDYAKMAEKLKTGKSLFYIGRGTSYPVALEGALKIKELSYISAEGYPSGEIKHGPIAIIDDNVVLPNPGGA